MGVFTKQTVHPYRQICASKPRLTVVAAQAGSAPVVVTQDGIGAVYWGVVVWAGVVRAERLAALGRSAVVSVAFHLGGVIDRSVAVRAPNGVTVHVLRPEQRVIHHGRERGGGPFQPAGQHLCNKKRHVRPAAGMWWGHVFTALGCFREKIPDPCHDRGSPRFL